MEDLLKLALTHAKRLWHRRTGLVLAIIVVAFSLISLFAKIDLLALSWWAWAVTGLAIIAVMVIWQRTHLPRVRKDRVGFAVAIAFEDSQQEKRLRADFVLELKNLLTGSDLRYRFQFVELPPQLESELQEPEYARDVMRRCNVHFLLYGRTRHRQTADGLMDVIDLNGWVRHGPVSQEMSTKISQTFSETLPRKYLINVESGLFACEFAAKHVEAAARYVIGLAAAVSGDFVYAEQLLVTAEERLKGYLKATQTPFLAALLSKVQGELGRQLEFRIATAVAGFTSTRNVVNLQQARPLLERVEAYNPEGYGWRLGAAMIAFVLDRDIETARRHIAECRKRRARDGSWQYSEAFLAAYDGDLEAAYRSYRGAFEAPTAPGVPMQVEEFIQAILDQEPERYWLRFCLGLINYKLKGDFAAARADLGDFVSRCESGKYRSQIDAARKWLGEMEQRDAS